MPWFSVIDVSHVTFNYLMNGEMSTEIPKTKNDREDKKQRTPHAIVCKHVIVLAGFTVELAIIIIINN